MYFRSLRHNAALTQPMIYHWGFLIIFFGIHLMLQPSQIITFLILKLFNFIQETTGQESFFIFHKQYLCPWLKPSSLPSSIQKKAVGRHRAAVTRNGHNTGFSAEQPQETKRGQFRGNPQRVPKSTYSSRPRWHFPNWPQWGLLIRPLVFKWILYN